MVLRSFSEADRGRGERAPHQLPSGRHGLSRTYVERNQRERMLDAVADVVSFKGVVAMRVEDVVSAAGVSRRTFYDQFKDKDEAFLAALDEIGRELLETVGAAYDAASDFPDGVIAFLQAFLEFAASDPRYADLCIVEVLAAGPTSIERRNSMLRSLAEMLHRGAESAPIRIRPRALLAEAVVGGIYEVVYLRVMQGKTSELTALLPDLAYSAMVPYVGHAAAELKVRELPPAIHA
jgi:AcrR family transcriptional regulator